MRSPSLSDIRLGAAGVAVVSILAYMYAGQMSCSSVSSLQHDGSVKCVDAGGSASVENITVSPATLNNTKISALPGGIPKLLHQIYSERLVPAHYRNWCESWNKENKDWIHVFWTDADIRAFLEREHPNALVLYDSYEHVVSRYDMARTHILWTYGGLYADMDIEAVGNVSAALADNGLYLVDSPYHKSETTQNSLMASRPKHPFWTGVFKMFWQRRPQFWQFNPDVMTTTGPGLLSAAVKNYEEHNATMPAKDRIGHLDWVRFLAGDRDKAGLVVTVHHYSHEWMWKRTREATQRICIWLIEAAVLVVGLSEFSHRRMQMANHWDMVHKLSKNMDIDAPNKTPLKSSSLISYGIA